MNSCNEAPAYRFRIHSLPCAELIQNLEKKRSLAIMHVVEPATQSTHAGCAGKHANGRADLRSDLVTAFQQDIVDASLLPNG